MSKNEQLPDDVLREMPQRLLNNADAFYYSGILCCLAFNAANVEAGKYRNPRYAAEAATSTLEKPNYLAAPPLVNFAFSIELYAKLLIFIVDRTPKGGHNIRELFLKLEKIAPVRPC